MTSFLPSRRDFLGVTAACGAATAFELAAPARRSFWIFKLLRPECVLVHPVATARLHCSDGLRQWIVEGDQSVCVTKDSDYTRLSGPDGSSVVCALEVPGEIRRTFSGTFEFYGSAEYVLPIVTMDCETATGSIVGAELPASAAHFDALAAQAIVSRSVVCGTGAPQHEIADFCDTTHCQFLRSPAPRDSVIARAVHATHAYVLVNSGRILPARYSAACGGQTEAGFHNGHRYESVRCDICRENGNSRRGHGWGLCQEGAMELARRSFTWREILAKYYPNARVVDQVSIGL